MHTPGKGMSGSALPYKRSSPSWLKITSQEVKDIIAKMAKSYLHAHCNQNTAACRPSVKRPPESPQTRPNHLCKTCKMIIVKSSLAVAFRNASAAFHTDWSCRLH